MNDASAKTGVARAVLQGVALLCVAAAGPAAANTYFKCVDAKGAVTVQQTACAVSSSQEERKVWTSSLQGGQPAPQPLGEPSSSHTRRGDDAARPKPR